MAEKETPAKEKDVSQIVRYLSTTFNKATAKLERPFRGSTLGANKAYSLQTEFAYFLNEIMQGPRCMVQKHITDCNEFLDRTIQEIVKEEKTT